MYVPWRCLSSPEISGPCALAQASSPGAPGGSPSPFLLRPQLQHHLLNGAFPESFVWLPFPLFPGHIIIPGLVCQALPHSTTIPQGWWHIAAHFVCSTPTPSSYDNRIPLFLEGTRPPLSSLFAVELLLLPRLQGGCTTQARPICTIHPPGQWDWLRWRWPYIRLAQNQSCNRCRS